jgi:hypothetical protein
MLTLRGAKRQTTNVAFSPDGRTLAVTGDTPGGVELWTLPPGQTPTRWIADSDWSVTPRFSPDGRILYAGCRTHFLAGRVLATGDHAPTPPDTGFIRPFDLSADGKWLVATRDVPVAKRANIVTGERVGFGRAKDGTLTEKWKTKLGPDTLAYWVTAVAGGRFVFLEDVFADGATHGELTLTAVAQTTGKEVARSPAPNLEVTYPPVASAGGEWLVGVARYRLQVFDAKSLAMAVELPNPEGKKQFTGVAFTPDGKHLLASGTAGYVRAFAVGGWTEVAAWDWKLGPLTCVAVSADGSLAAAGTKTGTVVVWDVDV